MKATKINKKRRERFERNGKWFELRYIHQSKTLKPLGKLEIEIPDPTDSDENQLDAFCQLSIGNVGKYIDGAIDGLAVAAQGKIRRIAADGPKFTESDYNAFCNALGVKIGEYAGKAEQLRADAIADWNKNKKTDAKYDENTVWKLSDLL